MAVSLQRRPCADCTSCHSITICSVRQMRCLMVFVVIAHLWMAMIIQCAMWSNEPAILTQTPNCPRVRDPHFGPLAAIVSNYFKERKVVAYPWVLTMAAALRYGGTTAVIDDQLHFTDIDADVLISLPTGWDSTDVNRILGGLAQRMRKEGYTVFDCIPECNGGNPTFIIPSLSVSAAGMTMVRHSFKAFFSNLFEDYGASRSIGASIGFFVGWLAAPIVGHLVIFDFHIYEDIEAHPTQMVLWEDVAWPFPAEGEEYWVEKFVSHVEFQAHGHWKVGEEVETFCDFAFPDGKWPEDVAPSRHANDVSVACAKDLARQGYMSFERCLPQQVPSNITNANISDFASRRSTLRGSER